MAGQKRKVMTDQIMTADKRRLKEILGRLWRRAGKMPCMHHLNFRCSISTVDFGVVRLRLVSLLLLLSLAPFAAQAGCADAPKAGVDWSGCEKMRLILRKADLQGARLGGVDLNGSDLALANLGGADLSRASVDRARFSGADLGRAKLFQLSGYRTNFSSAKLVGADLTKAELARSNVSLADLSGANLEKAELQRATLEGAILSGANLSGADLARTNLAKATLGGARFAQARMFLTRIEGVDLSAALGLNQSQLDSACGNNQTKLPKGLKLPPTWPCAKEE